MTPLEEVERLLSRLNRAEKTRVLQWVASELSGEVPGIEVEPEVCGGEPRIAGTRIPVWLLVQARRLGTTEAELLQCYPGLHAEDLANAWHYERLHADEIDRQIAANEAA